MKSLVRVLGTPCLSSLLCIHNQAKFVFASHPYTRANESIDFIDRRTYL